MYELVYRDGPSIGNAGGLSRLPLPTEIEKVPVPGNIMLVIDHLDNIHVQVKDIESWTSHDPTLSAVRHQAMSGWLNPDDSVEYKPYTSRKTTQLSGWMCTVGF